MAPTTHPRLVRGAEPAADVGDRDASAPADAGAPQTRGRRQRARAAAEADSPACAVAPTAAVREQPQGTTRAEPLPSDACASRERPSNAAWPSDQEKALLALNQHLHDARDKFPQIAKALNARNTEWSVRNARACARKIQRLEGTDKAFHWTLAMLRCVFHAKYREEGKTNTNEHVAAAYHRQGAEHGWPARSTSSIALRVLRTTALDLEILTDEQAREDKTGAVSSRWLKEEDDLLSTWTAHGLPELKQDQIKLLEHMKGLGKHFKKRTLPSMCNRVDELKHMQVAKSSSSKRPPSDAAHHQERSRKPRRQSNDTWSDVEALAAAALLSLTRRRRTRSPTQRHGSGDDPPVPILGENQLEQL